MRNSLLQMAAGLLICAAGPTCLAAQQTNCEIKDDTAYTNQIRQYTTAKSFTTELVDHLPWSSCVPAPDVYLHHIIGAPNVLDHVAEINGYMRLLASKTPRVKVFTLGLSEEGREMLLVAVSDEQNIANLDHDKQILARLADPRGLSDSDAQKLVAEGKPIYWALGSIHSPETGSPEMLMELAYRLAVEDTPFIQQIRANEIVLITPVVETDGRDREVDIYMYHRKHPDTTPYPLTWWGHYVSHDNNRDNLGQSLALSKNITKGYLEWHPTVMHDLHESEPYLYIMTGTGPYNAWLDPIVISEWQEMAYYEIDQLTQRGVIGVWTHGFYDGWAPNYMLAIGNTHNSIGRFYETFGNRGADTRERELEASETSREWYRPNPPLPKVLWSARNNINMQESGILFGMNNVANNHEKFLNNFYLKSKRAVAKGRTEGPAAWVLPSDDLRLGEQARLLSLLKRQGVEVHRASAAIHVKSAAAPGAKLAEATIPAGSYIIRMDQPYSRLADQVLDTQYYNPHDPRAYDDTGWSLGPLHNVKTVRVMDTKILDAPMTKIEGEISVTGGVQSGDGNIYVVDNNADDQLATFRFRLANVPMEAAEAPFKIGSHQFHAGSFIVRKPDASVDQAAKDLGLKAYPASAISVKTHPLAAPRVALMHNWTSTQQDGWYRMAMDNLKIPYTYIADTAIRQTPNLREKFDVVIVPPMGSLNSIVRGLPMRGKPMPWKNTPEMPDLVRPGIDSTDDMRGGLGYSGIENLEKFVSEGGELIAITSSSELPVQSGMTEMVSVINPSNLNAPGSVVLSNIEDKGSPIAYGYEDKLYLYYHGPTTLRVGFAGVGFGGGGRAGTGGPSGTPQRASGRGTATDPDIIQGRQYQPPQPPPHRTPREQELYIPDEIREYAANMIPPASEFPRVIVRFAPERELVLSGMMEGANNVAEKPAIIDVPHDKGHVVLFANNPMWREQTQGSYMLIFNAIMNWDHLDAGRTMPPQSGKETRRPER